MSTTETPQPDEAPVPDAPAGDADPTPEEIEQGKMFAMLSYASMFIGFPVCVLPLAMRDNAFALYHAKQATIVYLAAMLGGVAFMFIYLITCGIGLVALPLLFLLWVPTIHGLILAGGGQMEEPIGIFGLGDKIFGGLTPVKKD